MELLVIDQRTIIDVLSFDTVIAKVEESYAALYRGAARVAPVQQFVVPDVGGEIDVKSALMSEPGSYAAVKVGTGFPGNSRRGLPTSYASILLLDGSTGFPLALMDGDLITNWRTGAAAAVASRHLSRPESEVVGIVGGGIIAAMCLRALLRVRPIRRAAVWSRSPQTSSSFARTLTAELGLPVNAAVRVAEAVGAADIVVTATPSREALVGRDMLRPGTHVNAMGADGPGKQELDPRLTAGAKLVVDSLSQCRVAGELQHPLGRGLLTSTDEVTEIGAVVSGARPGRTRSDEITVFDSTGVAVQDAVVASLVYERAREKGLGSRTSL